MFKPYTFYHFGPFLYSTKITDDEVKKMLEICKEQRGEDARKLLAGHLKEEYHLPCESVLEVLKPYINGYCMAFHEQRGKTISSLKMTSSWVNYMKAGDFNPPHTHSVNDKMCLFSCVLFLDVPEDMCKEEHVANSYPPGSLEFIYGQPQENNNSHLVFTPQIGDFYMFPGWLTHLVYPFKSNGTRVSISANFTEGEIR